jgi:apolipoprotein D and lipocalin family protein
MNLYSGVSGGLSLLVAFVAAAIASAASVDNLASPVPVAYVDLNRYAGLWHEVARIPNRFQNQCARDVTAFYEVRDDGRLSVVNRCVGADGRMHQAAGIAKVIDTQTNARLKVSFVSFLGFRPFWGDYWVLGLGENYEYAVVGTPDRKYGWILAREARPDSETLGKARQVLKSQGYDIARFRFSSPDSSIAPARD